MRRCLNFKGTLQIWYQIWICEPLDLLRQAFAQGECFVQALQSSAPRFLGLSGGSLVWGWWVGLVLSASASAFMANPAALSRGLMWCVQALGVCVLFGVAKRATQEVLNALPWPALMPTALRLQSARSKVPTDLNTDYLLGFTSDKGQAVWVTQDQMMQHFVIAGMTGVGKTVASTLLMAQQMAKGGGVLWIDGKLDPQNMTLFFQLAKWMGRESDVRIIHPANPSVSNTYNFVLHGSAQEVASRILSLLSATHTNSAADYYKQAANQGLVSILSALKALSLAYNCMDLAILLTTPKALAHLHERLLLASGVDEEVLSAFTLFVHSCMQNSSKAQAMAIDAKKLRELFGGVAGRLFVLGSAECGALTQSYTPDVVLLESIRQGHLIYCALPSMGQLLLAQNFGKMLSGDLRSAIAQVQALPESQRPHPPFLIWMDEVASYASASALNAPFQQARSAHVSIGVGFQEEASLKELGEAFLETIMGNTLHKILFKPAEFQTANAWSKMMGQQSLAQITHPSKSYANGHKTGLLSGLGGWLDASRSMALTQLHQVSRVRVEDFFRLNRGQALVLAAGTHLYDVQIPMIGFSCSMQAQLGAVKISRPPMRGKHDQSIKSNAQRRAKASSLTELGGVVKGLYLQQAFRLLVGPELLSSLQEGEVMGVHTKGGRAVGGVDLFAAIKARAKLKYQRLGSLHPGDSELMPSSEQETLRPLSS